MQMQPSAKKQHPPVYVVDPRGINMSKIKNHLVYQFKISLYEIEPCIWRRIQVPAKYSFMPGFKRVVAGKGPSTEPSFIERAKT